MKMSKKLIIILVAILVVAIIACAALLILLLNKESPENPSGGGAGGVVYDPNQGDYVPPSGGAAENGVAIPGFGTWTIPPKVTEVTTDFFNPEANAGKYHLTFEVRIPNDSEQGYEVIYKSGLVEAGKHIQKVTLTHGFEAGEYDAYLFVQPYTADQDLTPTNNANIKFKLIVK